MKIKQLKMILISNQIIKINLTIYTNRKEITKNTKKNETDIYLLKVLPKLNWKIKLTISYFNLPSPLVRPAPHSKKEVERKVINNSFIVMFCIYPLEMFPGFIVFHVSFGQTTDRASLSFCYTLHLSSFFFSFLIFVVSCL